MKTHHFLFTPTFLCFLIFPSDPQRYSTFERCLLGLLLNNNNNIYIDAIRSLVNARDLQLECARVLE